MIYIYIIIGTGIIPNTYISYWKTSLFANQCTSKYQDACKEAGAWV